jgi:serine/threonine protein kinase
MALSAGTPVGPYEILAPLGSGGMGEVYRARDPRLGRDVAIKVLPAGLSTDPDRLHRFDREARAAAALNHPNILLDRCRVELLMCKYQDSHTLVLEIDSP